MAVPTMSWTVCSSCASATAEYAAIFASAVRERVERLDVEGEIKVRVDAAHGAGWFSELVRSALEERSPRPTSQAVPASREQTTGRFEAAVVVVAFGAGDKRELAKFCLEVYVLAKVAAVVADGDEKLNRALVGALLAQPSPEELREAWGDVFRTAGQIRKEPVDLVYTIQQLSALLAAIEHPANKPLGNKLNRYAILSFCANLYDRVQQLREESASTGSRSGFVDAVREVADDRDTLRAGVSHVLRDTLSEAERYKLAIWESEDKLERGRRELFAELCQMKERLKLLVYTYGDGESDLRSSIDALDVVAAGVSRLYYEANTDEWSTDTDEWSTDTADPSPNGRIFAFDSDSANKVKNAIEVQLLHEVSKNMGFAAELLGTCEDAVAKVKAALAQLDDMKKKVHGECGVVRMTDVGFPTVDGTLRLTYLGGLTDEVRRVRVSVIKMYTTMGRELSSYTLLPQPGVETAAGCPFHWNASTQMVEVKADPALFAEDCYAVQVTVEAEFEMAGIISGKRSLLKGKKGLTHVADSGSPTTQRVQYGDAGGEPLNFREVRYVVDTTSEHKTRGLMCPDRNDRSHLYLTASVNHRYYKLPDMSARTLRRLLVNKESEKVLPTVQSRRRGIVEQVVEPLGNLGMVLTWEEGVVTVGFSPDLFYRWNKRDADGLWLYREVQVTYELALVLLSQEGIEEEQDHATGEFVLTMAMPGGSPTKAADAPALHGRA